MCHAFADGPFLANFFLKNLENYRPESVGEAPTAFSISSKSAMSGYFKSTAEFGWMSS